LPGFLSGYSGTTRITFGDNDEWWVDVRLHLRRNEFRSAQAALIRPIMRYEGTVGSTTGNIDTPAYQNELVLAAIVAWNLTDENGDLLPLEPAAARRASVDVLPTEVFDKILDVVQKGTPGSNPDRAEEEAKDNEAFRSGSEASALPDEGALTVAS
jgi:hypothetical protein